MRHFHPWFTFSFIVSDWKCEPSGGILQSQMIVLTNNYFKCEKKYQSYLFQRDIQGFALKNHNHYFKCEKNYQSYLIWRDYQGLVLKTHKGFFNPEDTLSAQIIQLPVTPRIHVPTLIISLTYPCCGGITNFRFPPTFIPRNVYHHLQKST